MPFDKNHGGSHNGNVKKPKAPDGAFKGLGKGLSEKDLKRGYSKP